MRARGLAGSGSRLRIRARVRDGMFVEAEIIVAERTGNAVPVTAVGADGSRPARGGRRGGARAGHGGHPRWRLVEIREGLEPGDLLVARAGAFVRDGDRINPVPARSN